MKKLMSRQKDAASSPEKRNRKESQFFASSGNNHKRSKNFTNLNRILRESTDYLDTKEKELFTPEYVDLGMMIERIRTQ